MLHKLDTTPTGDPNLVKGAQKRYRTLTRLGSRGHDTRRGVGFRSRGLERYSMARSASAIQSKNARRALTVALAALAGSTFATQDAHAQSRGLLASPDTLSAPLLAQQTDPAPAAPPATPPPSSGDPAAGNSGAGTGGAQINIGGNSGSVVPGQANNIQKDEPGAEKKPEGMTFYDRIAGTSIFVQTGATIGTIFKGYQPDYNPQVSTYAAFSRVSPSPRTGSSVVVSRSTSSTPTATPRPTATSSRSTTRPCRSGTAASRRSAARSSSCPTRASCSPRPRARFRAP